MRFPFISALVTLGEPSAGKCQSGENRLSSEKEVDEHVWQRGLESLGSFVFSFKGEEALVGACEGF